MSRRSTRGFIVVAAAVMAVGSCAAGGAGKKRIVRAQKGQSLVKMHMHYATYGNSETEVTITSVHGRIDVGEEFEVIDQLGYVGRARVRQVDHLPGSCPQVTFDQATATLETRAQARPSHTSMVAVTPSRRDLGRARVMFADEIKDPPDLTEIRGSLNMGVDLDGDGRADLAQVYYDCPSKNPGGAGSAYCIDLYGRDGKGAWKVIENGVVPDCY